MLSSLQRAACAALSPERSAPAARALGFAALLWLAQAAHAEPAQVVPLAAQQASQPSPYDPKWASAPALRTLELAVLPGATPAQRGAAFKAAVGALQPGDRLIVGAGTYSIESFFSIDLAGSAAAPIRIEAERGTTPVLTRSDASQNVVNVGSGGPARFVMLRGFEIRGGSNAVRLFDCQNVWIDRCHLHDCAANGIQATSHDTLRLFLTRNEIHATGGKGEGIYLGANFAAVTTSRSIIAGNHVHDTGGSDGDGIELKQGSFANWIVENVVHDTNYPCVLVYGTGGKAPNLIERNILWNSADNVLQVQGEAVVRANLVVNGKTGFHSHDHQGQSKNLSVVHNTIVNTGRAADLAAWANRPGMVFANNVAYSLTEDSIRFGNGSAGVVLAGNVVVGPVVGASSGWVQGQGLADFADLSWDASALDATPSSGSALLGAAAPAWVIGMDLAGGPLLPPFEAGCLDAP